MQDASITDRGIFLYKRSYNIVTNYNQCSILSTYEGKAVYGTINIAREL